MAKLWLLVSLTALTACSYQPPLTLADLDPVLSTRWRQSQDRADTTVAWALSRLCRQSESGGLYLVDGQRYVDMTHVSSIVSTVFRQSQLEYYLDRYTDWVDCHCHVMTPERYQRTLLTDELKKASADWPDQPIIYRQLNLGLPSYDDMRSALAMELLAFVKHDQVNPDHRLYVVVPGGPVRVISYNLKPDKRVQLKTVSGQSQWATGKLCGAWLSGYSLQLGAYLDKHCRAFQTGDCQPFSLEELITLLNQTSAFDIRDRGYLELK